MWPLARQIGALPCRIVVQGEKSPLPALTYNNACMIDTGTRAEQRTHYDRHTRRKHTCDEKVQNPWQTRADKHEQRTNRHSHKKE